MTSDPETRRKMGILRGVYPIHFDAASKNVHEINMEMVDDLKSSGTVQDGDLVIITKNDRSGVAGQTNLMKIMRVGEHRRMVQNP